MTDRDPRQRGLLGAAWHLGYAARAAAAGVDEVNIGAPVGGFGLVDETHGGRANPVLEVMRTVYASSGANRFEVDISSPRDIQALAFDSEDGVKLCLAKLSGDALSLRLAGIDHADVEFIGAGTSGRLREGSESQSARPPLLRLSSYSVAIVSI